MKRINIIASTLIITLITNTMSWAFYVTLINMVMTPRIYAADQIFDQLENNFDLANPNANRNASTSAKDIVEKYKNADPGNDLSGTISGKYAGKGESPNLNVGKYGATNSNESILGNAASDGKSIGKSVTLPSMSGGTLNSNYTKDGGKTLTRAADGQIKIGTNTNTTPGTKTNTGEIFSSEQKHKDVKFNAGGRYGDEDGFISDIKNRKSQLFDAQSYDGVAYRTLVNGNNDNPAPNVRPNDPMFNAGRNEIGNAVGGTGNWLQNCNTESKKSTIRTHYPDYKEYYCSSPKKDNFNSCTITRDFTVPVYISGGNGDLTVCGNNCIRVWFGKRGEDYWKDGIHDNSLVMKFSKQAKVVSAKIIEATWDDSMRVTMDGKQIFAHIDGAFRDEDYLEPKLNWELSEYNALSSPIDITNKLNDILASSSTREVEMASRVWVGGSGDGFFHVELRFADGDIKDNHIQEPSGCYDAVKTSNSFCRFDRFKDLDIGTKRLPNNVLDLAKPLYEGDKGYITWKTNLEGYFCDPLAEDKICSYDASGKIMKDEKGNDLCYNYDDIKNRPDACSVYKNDAACVMDKETCAEGWFDEVTNSCYMFEQKYTCDRGHDVTREVESETNSCVGMIPCSGGTCETGPKEENKDFGKVVAYSNMVQYMQGEAKCTDPNDPSTCSVFEGKKEWCGRSVGFVNGLAKTDCCEKPQGTAGSMEAIMLAGSMIRNTNWTRVNQTLVSWTGGESGTWSTMANSVGEWTASAGKTVGEMWSNVTSSLTSVYENVAGNLGRTVGSASGGAAGTGQLAQDTMTTFGVGQLKQMAMNKAYDLLPGAVRDFVFDAAKSTAQNAVFSTAVTNFMLALNVIGWIYTAYQVTKMLLEMLLACDQKEMEASIHKNQKSCFTLDTERCVKYLNVGFTKKCVKKATDMCCYNSMLSRVIMQQAYPQLGIDPLKSQCVGLSITQIQKLDFDKIDLTEWINDAVQVGEVPDQYATFTEDSVMGNLPFKNENAQSTTERTKEAMGSEDNMIKAKQENTQAILEKNVDCSYLPRPAICDVGSTSVDPVTGRTIPKY
ncbi:conjugal transfer protein TraN [Lelliottia amnigena]|uniref:conjugal transfer protein TraN n=1 Tax=Lelliottia TaxID=1330545 RepID=UPI00192BFA61|nr:MULTISPECIES: conjugal transfer protein TraN [Lelliottia]MBL5885683.1 conjugal transfer protein TraN [Lelliottia aquatilis]MBL5923261.1 conjugal transfer protein TraN [Lelliottia amnigena]